MMMGDQDIMTRLEDIVTGRFSVYRQSDNVKIGYYIPPTLTHIFYLPEFSGLATTGGNFWAKDGNNTTVTFTVAPGAAPPVTPPITGGGGTGGSVVPVPVTGTPAPVTTASPGWLTFAQQEISIGTLKVPMWIILAAGGVTAYLLLIKDK